MKAITIMKITTSFFMSLVLGVSIAIAGNSEANTFASGVPTGQLYTEKSNPEAYCLAQNIYWESSIDNLAGQAAVADVVLNRVENKNYPNTICEVVKQGPVRESWKTKQNPNLPDNERKYNPIRNRCQFSWYCDGKSEEVRTPEENPKWRLAQEIAYKMIKFDYLRGISEGATHYHATYVSPDWAKEYTIVGRIGLHIFYRQN